MQWPHPSRITAGWPTAISFWNWGYWLEQLPEEDGLSANIGNQEMEARFIKAITSNAMAMQPMGETVNDGILYQIQIQVTYQIESEE